MLLHNFAHFMLDWAMSNATFKRVAEEVGPSVAVAQAKTIYQPTVRVTRAGNVTECQLSHQLAMSNDLCWLKTDSPLIERKKGTNRWQFSIIKRANPTSKTGQRKYGSAPTERDAQQQIFEFRLKSEPKRVQAQVRAKLQLLLRKASEPAHEVSSSGLSDDDTADTMPMTSESESDSDSAPTPAPSPQAQGWR